MRTRAAVCRAFGAPLGIEEIELAEPGPGEARIRLAACAICHSDIHALDGAWGGDLPAVFGHEAAGTVEAAGPGVSLKPGTPVVVTLIRSCGQCHYCAQGQRVHCETVFPLDETSPLSAAGAPVRQGLRTGAFAERVVVHESQVVAIPPEVPLDSAALLACGVITGFGAVVNTARLRAGAHVVVVGAGGVGLNSIQAAALAGARTVIAVDRVEAKLAVARRFGATHAVAGGDGALDAILAATGGRGADYVFVTVGAKPAYDQALGMLARRGTLVAVGMPAEGVTTPIEPGDFAWRGQRVLGSFMGHARVSLDVPYLVELYRQGRLKLDELISGRYPLSGINEAIASTRSGEALRNVIVF